MNLQATDRERDMFIAEFDLADEAVLLVDVPYERVGARLTASRAALGRVLPAPEFDFQRR